MWGKKQQKELFLKIKRTDKSSMKRNNLNHLYITYAGHNVY